jgi:predicted nucleic-acid-binding protein
LANFVPYLKVRQLPKDESHDLDTNVLVRYIMQDDAKQSAKATKLVESLTGDEPGFVTLVSVVELVWVLSSSYALTREQVIQALKALLRAKQLVVDQADQVAIHRT